MAWILEVIPNKEPSSLQFQLPPTQLYWYNGVSIDIAYSFEFMLFFFPSATFSYVSEEKQ